MKIDCRELRDRLTAVREIPLEVERHIERCAACRRYAQRLRTAQQLLRGHHGNIEPDAAFAARVAARLPQGPTEILGWAALKLLPATVALAIALGWIALETATPTPAPAPDQGTLPAETAAPTDDLVSWVIEQAEDER